MDCVYKPQSAAHEIARQDETDGTGGNNSEKLEHKSVLYGVSVTRYSTKRYPERFS
jgi:hypothetical protein